MTYHEAIHKIARIRAEESADFERRLAEARGPDGMLPRRDHLPLREQARLAEKEMSARPALFHRERKGSRVGLLLASGHHDGRLRWVAGIPQEGSPQHPRWQATLAASEGLTVEEMAEDDWWVESYDPLDF